MKRLSIRLLLLALVISVIGSSFTPKARVHATHPAKTSAGADQFWYWYVEPDDYLDAYADLSHQILAMEEYWGVLVNTSSNDGVLLESGYNFNAFPHMMIPQISLYAHY